jgi:hypothetical protein
MQLVPSSDIPPIVLLFDNADDGGDVYAEGVWPVLLRPHRRDLARGLRVKEHRCLVAGKAEEGVEAPLSESVRLPRHTACSGLSMDIKETNPGRNVPKQQRDRPLGDQGSEKTWEPPHGEQGVSNRSDDEATDEPAEPRTT